METPVLFEIRFYKQQRVHFEKFTRISSLHHILVKSSGNVKQD